MPRPPKVVPDNHGVAARPSVALRALGVAGNITRPLGGKANMHWLVRTSAGDVVLRRYGQWHETLDEVAYELRTLERARAMGWPVPEPLTEPVRVGRHIWCVFSYLRGRAPRGATRLRDCGRLLAELHADLASINDVSQRPGWRRSDELLGAREDGTVDEVIRKRVLPEHAAVLLRYADMARERFAALRSSELPSMVVHMDVNPWNLRYAGGTLSALLDFDSAHADLRIAEFVWTWRGEFEDVLHGFEDVTPLDERERELLLPMFWANILESARSKIIVESDALSDVVPMQGRVGLLQRSALSDAFRHRC